MTRAGRGLWAAILFLTVGADRTSLDAEMPKQSARVATYTIHARLMPADQTVRAKMEILWRNETTAPVPELYFHLYLNAFRDRKSTFMKESDGRGRRQSEWSKDHPGGVEVSSMKTSDGKELWNDESRAFEAPDDGNRDDRTLARVTLPSPVPPGETVHLTVEFTSTLPRVFRRTGWAGNPDKQRHAPQEGSDAPEQHPESDLFFMVAQWYPKIAVLKQAEDGTLRWNRHQFHAGTEFFGEYGVYQVHLTVPKEFVVGATGVRTNTTKNEDSTITYVYKQADVHDFAWTASPHFLVKEYKWTFDGFCRDADQEGVQWNGQLTMGTKLRQVLAETARNLGVDPEELKPKGEVTVRFLVQKDHDRQWTRFKWSAGAALCCYGIWFGSYPYEVLTVVDPPRGGGAAGGMEYPTLITVWGDRKAPWYATGMEGVTIHEFGHQYFYGLLGSNEFEEAWLDEGFTSFSDARCFEVAYGSRIATTRYGSFVTPRLRPFESPSIFGRLKSLLRLEAWLGRIPPPWSEPDTIIPDPGGNGFFAYDRELPFLHFTPFVDVPQPLSERAGMLDQASRDALILPGWDYATRRDYVINAYRKPTVFLYTLRGLMGAKAFDTALYQYAEKYRFAHPTSEDFVKIVNEHAPKGGEKILDGFLQSMIETATALDVAILDATQRQVDTEQGSRWEIAVKVQRRGAILVPIGLWGETAEGGRTRLAVWQGPAWETTKTIRVLHDRPLRSVRVALASLDPEDMNPASLRDLDADITNNARFLGKIRDQRPAVVLAARWTLYAEEIMRTYMGAGR